MGAVSVDVNQWQFVIGGVANPLPNVVGDVNGAVTFYGWTWNPDRNDSEGSLRVRNLNVVAQNGLGARVSFMLSQPARVQMTVLSPTGKAVRTLPPMEAKIGLNALVWDGKSQTGAELGRGFYLVLVRAVDEEGQEVQAARSVVVR
jgi:hypothetical protein